MTTQTDRSEKQDFQVQANLEQAAVAIQNQARGWPAWNKHSKKRKLSTPSTSAKSAQGKTATEESTTDPSILNSEVYRIYCRSEDPFQASEKIRKLKTCIEFESAKFYVPEEEDFKSAFEEALKKLWSLGPSKWEQIEKFLNKKNLHRINYESNEYGEILDKKLLLHSSLNTGQKYALYDIIDHGFDKIKMLLPNGIEYFYVKNFKLGVGVSKWYRGVSISFGEEFGGQFGDGMAKLNVLGLTNSSIEKIHYDFLKKKPVEIAWTNFANEIVKRRPECFTPDGITGMRKYGKADYDIQESKTENTVVVNVGLQFWNLENISNFCYTWRIAETFHGTSTRPLKKTRRPKNESEEMTKEAKKAALMKCFRDRLGITEFNDILVDEFQRPVNDQYASSAQ